VGKRHVYRKTFKTVKDSRNCDTMGFDDSQESFLAGFCGDFCGKCPNYSQECAGCIPSLHQECFFIQCCMKRSLEHCGLCKDFPCETLVTFIPDDRPECPPGYHIQNLTERMSMGTASWIESEKRRWNCG
jgi:hypothetical protein